MKKKICAVLALVLALLMLSGCLGLKRQTWPQTELTQKLPAPKFRLKTFYDSADSISATFDKVSDERYQEYVKACRELGFTLETQESSDYFIAFDESGYRLELDRYGGKNEMNLYFAAPRQMGEFIWPNTEAGRIVPAPPSTYGVVEWEYEDSFCIYVGNMTRDDFQKYIEECRLAGFSVDYRKDADYFYGENADGFSLSVDYAGFNTVCITLSGGYEDYDY